MTRNADGEKAEKVEKAKKAEKQKTQKKQKTSGCVGTHGQSTALTSTKGCRKEAEVSYRDVSKLPSLLFYRKDGDCKGNEAHCGKIK